MSSTDSEATPPQHCLRQSRFAFPETYQFTRMLYCVVKGTEGFTLLSSICSLDMMATPVPPVTDLS